jgi:hypothetical protein
MVQLFRQPTGSKAFCNNRQTSTGATFLDGIQGTLYNPTLVHLFISLPAAAQEDAAGLRAKLHAAIRKGKALEKEKVRLEKTLASASAETLPASAPASPDVIGPLSPETVHASTPTSPYFTPSGDSPSRPSPDGASGEPASTRGSVGSRNQEAGLSEGGPRAGSVSPSKAHAKSGNGHARTGNGHAGTDLMHDAERAAGLQEQMDAMQSWLSKAEGIKLERRATQAEATAVCRNARPSALLFAYSACVFYVERRIVLHCVDALVITWLSRPSCGHSQHG